MQHQDFDNYTEKQLVRAAFEAACPCFKTDVLAEGFTWTRQELIEVIETDGASLHEGDDYPYHEEPLDDFDGCPYVARIRALRVDA